MTTRNAATPYLCCRGADAAIEFYSRALGVAERSRVTMPDGRVGHAELAAGNFVFFLADEFPEEGFASRHDPETTHLVLHLRVADADAAFSRAVAAGASPLRPVADSGHGERAGKIRDPYGHVWLLASSPAVPRLEEFWEKLDLITPMALRVAATLRIADHVRAGRGELASLAAAAGADRETLGRLLRFLAARGFFREEAPGRFALAGESVFLLDDDPAATRGWLDLEGFGGRMDLSFFELLAAVRTGKAPRSTGKPDLTPAETASYDTVMEAQSIRQAPTIVAALAFSTPPRHVVDLGGGTGTLLAEMLRRWPDARGSLVELPATAAAARARLESEGLRARCDVIAGDILAATLPRGDLYVLKFVLHAFEDDAAARILARCREAGGQAARCLVLERTVTADDDRAPFTAMDLRMLILGHGKERTLEEYAALARTAGLAVASAKRTAAGVHAIELRPIG